MSPRLARRIHAAGMAVWAPQFGIAFLLPAGWRVPYLVVSIYANFVGHWAGWSAERPSEIASETGR